MLHSNEITDDGLRAIASAIESKRFKCKCLKLHSNKTNLSAEVEFMKACASSYMDIDLKEAWDIAYKQLYPAS